MSNQASGLAESLETAGYAGLFMVYGHEAVDEIWNKTGSPAALAQLVMDKSATTEVRFLAAEILFRKDKDYPPASAKSVLARIYADALAQDIMGVGNPWGLPGHLDSAGRHIVSLGDAAVAPLTPLLDDDTEILYEGSEEATIGNDYEYRVKDFAAYFISKIKGIAYSVHETPAERDAEIKTLKTKLS